VFSGLENPIHLLVIALVVLIIFGPARLPGIGRAVGSGIRELRGSLTGEDQASEKKSDDTGA
jgi:sec-independent protein translocase protein TatA